MSGYNGGMRRRFQFSLGRLMAAIGILAVGLWLVRVALDTERLAVVALAAICLPIILGAAIGKLFGSAASGAAIVGLGYWFVIFAVIAMAAVGALVSQLSKWIW